MLAIITRGGTSLVDPVSFKCSSNPIQISTSLECSASSWSSDNSQLYLANSSSIKRYTPSEYLLEELYCGSDTVTCLTTKGRGNILFFASANKVWSLDCTHSPGRVLSSLEPHKNPITKISASSDGTLLASVSDSVVFVHNLTLSSHVQLKGLSDRKPVTCCLFHQHSRTRLLLSVGRDLVIYDSTRPSSPLKTICVPGGGDIVGVAASPFSKTLIAAVTSNDDVALIDLDKENGILKTVNVKIPLTCCAFTVEGAAIYLGTECGKLLILDLRSLEKEPKSFTIGDGNSPIEEIQTRPKSHVTSTASTKVQSPSSPVVRSSPQRSARTTFTGSVVITSGAKSPVRIAASSKIRGGGGIMPKQKPLLSVRTPLSETKNFGLDQLVTSHSPTLSRRVKPLKLQRRNEAGENHETQAGPPLPSTISRGLAELADGRQHPRPSLSHKTGQDVRHLGLGSAPESISGHLAALRVQSGPPLNNDPSGSWPRTTARQTISSSVDSAAVGRKLRTTSSGSAQRKGSSKSIDVKVHAQQTQERRSMTPDNGDDRLDLSSPELPCEPITPIPLGKNLRKAPLVGATSSGVLGLTSPEVARWAAGRNEKRKGKERVVEPKKTRFTDAKESEGGNKSEDGDGAEICTDEGRYEEREELSLQVSPRRPTTLPAAWLQSPHRLSTTNLNMNAAAQEFLRNIVHDVMYDFQRESKAEMVNLHLDLVRMGRGWKQELRELMEEWKGEIQELKAENGRLKEENERLRGGG